MASWKAAGAGCKLCQGDRRSDKCGRAFEVDIFTLVPTSLLEVQCLSLLAAADVQLAPRKAASATVNCVQHQWLSTNADRTYAGRQHSCTKKLDEIQLQLRP